ncbi:MAG TPA: hypothetical protein VKR32_19075 [Puia sp.]|nr:hypothetical protein [Puia sp.]
MTPKLLLRIASLVMLLHTIGHSIGAITWKQAPNKTIADLIAGMESNHFDFFGRQVSLAMFFEGYGVLMILVLLFITILLWLLSGHTGNALTRKLLPWLCAFLILFGISEWFYFFPLPSIFSVLSGILCLLACAGKAKSNPSTAG